jgi:hypothetical protein
MSACSKGCGRAVVFVTMTATKKLMPVDPVPDELGNVYARTIGGRLAGHVRVKGEQCPTGWQTYMPHWRTCEVALHLEKYETGARGAPGPNTQPQLFDTP